MKSYEVEEPEDSINFSNHWMLIILITIIVFFYLIISSFTNNNGYLGLGILELIVWGFLICFILLTALKYFFNIDIFATIQDEYTKNPQINIYANDIPSSNMNNTNNDNSDIGKTNTLTPLGKSFLSFTEYVYKIGKRLLLPFSLKKEISYIDKDNISTIPSLNKKQVFHVTDNVYTFPNAKNVCKAFGAELASFNQLEETYRSGGEWCGYGWSKNLLALYPTQKDTYNKLQNIPGHEHDCGRPGINGGFIANPNVKFGVNCYGKKPEISPEEANAMESANLFPKTMEEINSDKKVKKYENNIGNILLSPFNHQSWSK